MVPNQCTSLRGISEKFLNEKFLLQMLTSRYKIKYRTWKIMADGKEIGVVTTASRPIIKGKDEKIVIILLQFAFLSPVDSTSKSKFEGHKMACFNLFSKKADRVVPRTPGDVKVQIKDHIIDEIKKRESFWLSKVWDLKSQAKIEIV